MCEHWVGCLRALLRQRIHTAIVLRSALHLCSRCGDQRVSGSAAHHLVIMTHCSRFSMRYKFRDNCFEAEYFAGVAQW